MAVNLPALQAQLPPGERILWQGAPKWQRVVLDALHAGKVAAYFGALALWQVVSAWHEGLAVVDALRGAVTMLALGALCCAILAGIAWLMTRSTRYTITTGRVVMQVGVALPLTVNIPLDIVADAQLRPLRSGCGDLALTLQRGTRFALLVLWPHARPWHWRQPQPMLRGIADSVAVARILADAMGRPRPGQSMAVAVPAANADSATINPPHAATA